MDKYLNLKIKGIDSNRVPHLDNNNYIDVVYELTEKAPRDWCIELNNFLSQERHKTKIDPKNGLYIETWVRNMDEIVPELNHLKQKIIICNKNYNANLQEKNARLRDLHSEKKSEALKKLENIIANLKFD